MSRDFFRQTCAGFLEKQETVVPRSPFFQMLLIAVLLCTSVSTQADEKPTAPRGDLLLVIGSPGEPEYQKQFEEWAKKWSAAAQTGHVTVTQLGEQDNTATTSGIESALHKLSQENTLPLWIVLIGHGTFDGRSAKFNLPGPDLEPGQLKNWLQAMTRPVSVIDCSSSSAPFLMELSAPRRVVISATASGNEVNFARFGGYLASSINDLAADLDKDQQVSLLEAFLKASSLTEEFYNAEGRLPTEHAVIDDNGDHRPVPLSGFDGIRPIQRIESGNQLPDGLLAHQWHLCPSDEDANLPPEVIAKRNELELQIAQLRSRKQKLPEDQYYKELEKLLLEMARLLVKPTPDS
ncbi:hypothetical protein [Planctomicrobium piriforme]|uniref:Caspase domain-containing protein n=1 Tax=Planctomicrobium piriforme TaxID=1576369 RepID=A0A1I3CXE3_9PLAN|nr:hypothetical protein [Planctomicrobium piriforme]SFH79113.1 hypothetical protein SAMN05421753_1032 [Planctomicrobium piriforme]